ncbi:MAG: Abi-alpha family protein [bacterium]
MMPDPTDLATLAAIGDLIERFTREPREVFKAFFLPIAGASGELIASQVRLRGARLEELAARVRTKIGASTRPPDRAAQRIVFEIINQASLLEEPEAEMMDRWAGLLASAATDPDLHPSFPDILKHITPLEARFLDELRRCAWDDCNAKGLVASLGVSDDSKLSVPKDNLARLNLIRPGNSDQKEPSPGASYAAGPDTPTTVIRDRTIHGAKALRLTPLGYAFVDACNGPRAAADDE